MKNILNEINVPKILPEVKIMTIKPHELVTLFNESATMDQEGVTFYPREIVRNQSSQLFKHRKYELFKDGKATNEFFENIILIQSTFYQKDGNYYEKIKYEKTYNTFRELYKENELNFLVRINIRPNENNICFTKSELTYEKMSKLFSDKIIGFAIPLEILKDNESKLTHYKFIVIPFSETDFISDSFDRERIGKYIDVSKEKTYKLILDYINLLDKNLINTYKFTKRR